MMLANNTEVPLKKFSTLFLGFLILCVIIADFFISLTQPLYNLGFRVKYYEPYLLVNKIAANSPAEEAGITKDLIIKSINNENIFDTEVYELFYFGEDVKVTTLDNSVITYKLEKLNFFQQIKTLSVFVKIKFLYAILMIISGVLVILFNDVDKTIRPLVFCIFFIALTTVNVFNAELSADYFNKITYVLLDMGIYFLFASLFMYFYHLYKYINKKNLFKHLQLLPLTFFIIKYIHVIIYKCNGIERSFGTYDSIVITLLCIFTIFLFIYILFTFPKSLTVTFKFFLLGFVFAIIPLLVNHFAFILDNSKIMSERDKFSSISAFIFLPIMIFISVLQNKNKIKSKRIVWIASYIGYICLAFPIFFTVYDHSPRLNVQILALLYAVFTPLFFCSVNFLFSKIFSQNAKKNQKKLADYAELINPITDTHQLHVVTTEEIVKTLNCSYVFYYKKIDNVWQNFYTWGNISKKHELECLEEASTKTHVHFYKDGSFSIPIIRDKKPSGVIYIGPKVNSEFYLPGEHLIIVDIIKEFHKHYLMYTNNNLLKELKQKNTKMIEIQENTILSMANLIESRDGGTGAHVKRTAEYSVLIAKRAQEKGLFANEIDDKFIEKISKAAPMHDIGKIIVSDAVLKKPGRLTPEEFEEMKLHTTEGNRIVREVLSNAEDEEYINMTSKIAMHHHEKWDGSGYPRGLKEHEIPLCARILAIADVFDALVSPRCYKEPMYPNKAFNIIRDDAGKHFDPVLVELFLELKEEALEVMKHEFL